MTAKLTRYVGRAPRSDVLPAADKPTEPAIDAGDGLKRAPERPPTPPMWTNERWAVTDAGLESRHVINGYAIEYVVEKGRLLQVEPGTNVSRWAHQIAEKSWVDDPEALIDALTEAIRCHHPDQMVVDLDATAGEVRRVWALTRRRT